jgi:polygalacturonase
VGIRVSLASVAVNVDCSRSNPCRVICLQDVALTYKSRPIAATKSCCRDVQGTTLDFVLPPSCL